MQSYQLGQRFTTAGLPLNGGKAYFYLTETLTLEDVFEDDELATPLANPVVADSAGFFPEQVYLDPTKTYRLILKTSADVTIFDADPINTAQGGSGIDGGAINDDSIPADALAPGAIEAKLGYTPADIAGDTFTGAVVVTGGKTTVAAGAAGYASLNIPDAVADPSSPVNGDVWHEANVLKARLNAVTETLAMLSSLSSMTTTLSDFTGDGYIKIGPLYIQWGSVSVTPDVTGTSGEGAVTFPAAFPTACGAVVATQVLSAGGVASTNYAVYVRSVSASGCSIGLDSSGTPHNVTTVYWLAVGN